MSYDWTAEAVYELVKGWPEEARAEDCDFDPAYGEWCCGLRSGWLTPAHAAALHVASGLRWLIVNGYAPLFRPNDRGGIELKTRGETEGPTELHAIAHAISAIMGGAAETLERHDGP